MIVAMGLFGPAAEGPAGLELDWEAPPQCPDRATLLGMIDTTLGEVDPETLRAVRVDGVLAAGETEGFTLELSLDQGRSGTRTMQGPSCQELSEAAAPDSDAPRAMKNPRLNPWSRISIAAPAPAPSKAPPAAPLSGEGRSP